MPVAARPRDAAGQRRLPSLLLLSGEPGRPARSSSPISTARSTKRWRAIRSSAGPRSEGTATVGNQACSSAALSCRGELERWPPPAGLEMGLFVGRDSPASDDVRSARWRRAFPPTARCDMTPGWAGRGSSSSGKETGTSGDRQARVLWAPSDGPASDTRPRAPNGSLRPEPGEATLSSRNPAVHRPFGLFCSRLRPTRARPKRPAPGHDNRTRERPRPCARERGISVTRKRQHLGSRDVAIRPWPQAFLFSADPVLQGTPESPATEVVARVAIRRPAREHLVHERLDPRQLLRETPEPRPRFSRSVLMNASRDDDAPLIG